MWIGGEKLWFFGGRRYLNMDKSLLGSDLTWCFYDMIMHEWSDIVSLPSKVENILTMFYHIELSTKFEC